MDIVERLRRRVAEIESFSGGDATDADCREAANEIEALRARVSHLSDENSRLFRANYRMEDLLTNLGWDMRDVVGESA